MALGETLRVRRFAFQSAFGRSPFRLWPLPHGHARPLLRSYQRPTRSTRFQREWKAELKEIAVPEAGGPQRGKSGESADVARDSNAWGSVTSAACSPIMTKWTAAGWLCVRAGAHGSRPRGNGLPLSFSIYDKNGLRFGGSDSADHGAEHHALAGSLIKTALADRSTSRRMA